MDPTATALFTGSVLYIGQLTLRACIDGSCVPVRRDALNVSC
jgi:hypothetical protein